MQIVRMIIWTLAIAYLATAMQGCSVMIAGDYRYGRNPPEWWAGTTLTRKDVERVLGKPIEEKSVSDGRLRAVYEYTTLEGGVFSKEARDAMAALDIATLFAAEVIFFPMAYLAKTRFLNRKEYIYDSEGAVVGSFPEKKKEYWFPKTGSGWLGQ